MVRVALVAAALGLGRFVAALALGDAWHVGVGRRLARLNGVVTRLARQLSKVRLVRIMRIGHPKAVGRRQTQARFRPVLPMDTKAGARPGPGGPPSPGPI